MNNIKKKKFRLPWIAKYNDFHEIAYTIRQCLDENIVYYDRQLRNPYFARLLIDFTIFSYSFNKITRYKAKVKDSYINFVFDKINETINTFNKLD